MMGAAIIGIPATTPPIAWPNRRAASVESRTDVATNASLRNNTGDTGALNGRNDISARHRRGAYFAYLRKSGLRFSFSALTPSRDSSVS